MTSFVWPKKRIYFLIGMVVVYIVFGVSVNLASNSGLIQKEKPTPVEHNFGDVIPEGMQKNYEKQLETAEVFVAKKLLQRNGHIRLTYILYNNGTSTYDYNTNSEAISYYLLWNAIGKNKEEFDNALVFLETYMIHPDHNYMMWRLNASEMPQDDGSNIASDADLRAIKALLIAEKHWGDLRYSQLIDRLSLGVEKVAITKDGLLAPYGGSSGKDSIWTAQEVWLSYSDFTVFESLAKRRGEPWTTMNENMKKLILKSQLYNGLYNSQLTEEKKFGNGIDAGGYGINSMWIMIRNAESQDPELRASAQKSLDFYKLKFSQDGELYALYSSNGDALSPSDAPWVYALVGRAAVRMEDEEFSKQIIDKLLNSQVNDENSQLFGAFPEPDKDLTKVSQFTMQESILTLQDF